MFVQLAVMVKPQSSDSCLSTVVRSLLLSFLRTCQSSLCKFKHVRASDIWECSPFEKASTGLGIAHVYRVQRLAAHCNSESSPFVLMGPNEVQSMARWLNTLELGSETGKRRVMSGTSAVTGC